MPEAVIPAPRLTDARLSKAGIHFDLGFEIEYNSENGSQLALG